MSSTTLQDYLAAIKPVAAPIVVALDDAIRTAQPDLDVAIKYRTLTYALRGDWHTWVCAVQATMKGVCLRFLYGVLQDDPRGVLRAGTSVLKTWDLGFKEIVDPAAEGAHVTEAVPRYGGYKANAQDVLEVSRAAAKRSRPPKNGS